MKGVDYIFIICCVIAVFALLVSIMRPFVPKYLMRESKEINIKKGKIIGSLTGIIIGIFMCYYLWINGFLNFL